MYNYVFGDLQTHYEKQVITVNISDKSPHSFFQAQVYLSVAVTDNSGKTTYERNVKGITDLTFDEVPIREGFIIKVFHLEAPARLISPDGIAYTGVNRTTHRFLVTRYGLKNLALGNNPLFNFLQKLHGNARDLRNNFVGSDNSRNLLFGAHSLPQPYRTEFVMKYNQMMSECSIMYVIGSTDDNSRQGSLAVSTKQGFQGLVGTLVNIKNADEIMLQDTITPYQNLFQNLGIPFGVYSVEFRGSAAEAYIITPQYIEVRDNINPILFDFIQIDDSMLVNNFALDTQMMYINAKASEIAMSPLKSSTSLYLSDEKKLLLAAIRSLPTERVGYFLNRYGNLFSDQSDDISRLK